MSAEAEVRALTAEVERLRRECTGENDAFVAGYREGLEAGAKAAREAVARKLESLRVSPAAASLYAEIVRMMDLDVGGAR